MTTDRNPMTRAYQANMDAYYEAMNLGYTSDAIQAAEAAIEIAFAQVCEYRRGNNAATLRTWNSRMRIAQSKSQAASLRLAR